MARTKKVKVGVTEVTEQATKEIAEELADLFDSYTLEKFGCINPPDAFVTSTGIRPLDYIIGGGFFSSNIITFSSTPETGKSTIAYQFAKQFLEKYENGLCVFFDCESTGGTAENQDEITASVFQESRAEIFDLVSDKRFKYNRRPFTIRAFFEYLDGLIQRKREIQTKTGKEVRLLICLDSLASLTYSKLDATEEFDKIPGKLFYLD